MSTQDDKAKEVSADGAAGPIILFFMLGLAASLVLGWGIFPKLLYSQKKQPIDFNHALHAGEMGGCESCHFFREDGSFSGIPKLAQCVECHEEAQGSDPNEIKFVEEYVANGREVPWLVYARQPDCVFFSHAAHVKKAEMECSTCHGHIGESKHSRVYEENRITGYSRDIWGKNPIGLKKHTWDRMKMDDCAECHATKEIKTDVETLPWPINWAPLPYEKQTGNQASVKTVKEACFVCHK
jgi:hypothetical protein